MVNDVYLAPLHNVFFVAFVKAVCAQELANAVNALTGLLKECLGREFCLLLNLRRSELVILIDLDKLGRQIRQHKRIRIIGTHHHTTLLGKIGLLLLLIDHIIECFLKPVPLLLIKITAHLEIELIDRAANRRHLIEAVKLLVLRHAELDLKQLRDRVILGVFVRIFRFQYCLCLRCERVTKCLLLGNQLLNARLYLAERQRIVVLHRAGNDQGRTCFVD